MTAGIENEEGLTIPVYWQNDQWAVTGYGIEQRNGSGSYTIEANQLGDSWDKRLPDWPRHMQSKSWVNLELFMEAFMMALAIHSGKYRRRFQERWYEATVIDLNHGADVFSGEMAE